MMLMAPYGSFDHLPFRRPQFSLIFLMLLHDASLLMAAVPAPGAVVAPAWLLPTAAAVTALFPATLIPLVKGMEEDKRKWSNEAPEQDAGFGAACELVCSNDVCTTVCSSDAFCVQEAGDKGGGLCAYRAPNHFFRLSPRPLAARCTFSSQGVARRH